jgi:hypothetical protein
MEKVDKNQVENAVEADISTEMNLAEVPAEQSKFIATPYFNPVLWSQMKGMAATFVRSGALPKHLDTLEKVIVQMQTGIEMGMKPMESIQSLYIVNGNVNIWGKATVKALRKHGWTIAYPDETETSCTARVTNNETGETYEETFNYEDAVNSGYTIDSYNKEKVGWKKGANRIQKMRYNALSKIIKSYIPEVLEGVSDIQEVAEDYMVIDIEDEGKKKDIKKTSLSTPSSQKNKIDDFLKSREVSKTNGKTIIDVPATTTPEEPKEAKQDAKEDEEKPSEGLRKRYFAIANEKGMDPEAAKKKIKEHFKVESFNDLTSRQVSEMIELIQK